MKLHFLIIIFLITLSSFSLSASENNSDIYITGFIQNNDYIGIENASIVITSRHKKLFALKSIQKGWFETSTPLSNLYLNKELRITVIKSGYQLVNKSFTIDRKSKHIKISLQPVSSNISNGDYGSRLSNVFYGHIYNRDTSTPVNGAVITITDENNLPIGSAVTRDSGYFSMYYQNKPLYKNKDFDYKIKHYVHNSKSGKIQLDPEPELFEKSLSQEEFGYSLGLALHYQTTGTIADKESGGALMLNLTIYREDIIVVDNFLPRYKKSGIIGYDFSLGVIPYRESTEGMDVIDSINLIGIGAAYAKKDFLLPIRFGVTYSNTNNAAVYIGLNIPLYYFF